MTSRYCIKDGYIERPVNDFDNEIGKRDECQDEVYAHARKLLDESGLHSVLDIGTGSGFKLLKYFGDTRTIGTDLPSTVAWLASEYPDRYWLESHFDVAIQEERFADLVIAADVIEHLSDPDELLRFIRQCNPALAIISTPNRDNLAEHTWNGPPRNLCHVREWSAPEFREYLEQHFEVLEHVFPDPARRDYSTMWAVVRPRS